jgi:hypothetical protein
MSKRKPPKFVWVICAPFDWAPPSRYEPLTVDADEKDARRYRRDGEGVHRYRLDDPKPPRKKARR